MGNRWSQREVQFRTQIKEIRERQGMTQAEVARKLGKPQSFISKIESGERQLYFFEVRDLCLACNTDWVKFLLALEKRLTDKP